MNLRVVAGTEFEPTQETLPLEEAVEVLELGKTGVLVPFRFNAQSYFLSLHRTEQNKWELLCGPELRGKVVAGSCFTSVEDLQNFVTEHLYEALAEHLEISADGAWQLISGAVSTNRKVQRVLD